MPCFGVDIHPQFQAGISIEQIRAEGFDFMAVKVSEGTDSSYMAAGSADWLARSKACGLLSMGYHYLNPGNEVQQAHVFAEQLLTAGVPGMVDAEAMGPDGRTPSLTIDGIRAFFTALANFDGVHVPLLYLPHWFWAEMGSPDLTGLPPLWASNYVPGAGYASQLYQTVTPNQWAAYGGNRVAVLQFTDQAAVAGHNVDADAYQGTRDQLAAFLNGDIDLTPDESSKLTDIWHTLLDPMSSEVPGSTYTAPPRDFWRNTDRASYMGEQVVNAQQAAITALSAAVAAQHGLTVDDVKAAVDAELGKVVNVKVTIDQPPAPTA